MSESMILCCLFTRASFPITVKFFCHLLFLTLSIYNLNVFLRLKILFLAAGSTREPDSYSGTIRRASLYVSLAGYLCGIILMGIILIASFANKGSDIYVRPPGEESGKFWISQA